MKKQLIRISIAFFFIIMIACNDKGELCFPFGCPRNDYEGYFKIPDEYNEFINSLTDTIKFYDTDSNIIVLESYAEETIVNHLST